MCLVGSVHGAHERVLSGIVVPSEAVDGLSLLKCPELLIAFWRKRSSRCRTVSTLDMATMIPSTEQRSPIEQEITRLLEQAYSIAGVCKIMDFYEELVSLKSGL